MSAETDAARVDDRAARCRRAVACCAFCEQPAAANIPSNPGRVRPTHALEFWTGLLAYSRNRTD